MSPPPSDTEGWDWDWDTGFDAARDHGNEWAEREFLGHHPDDHPPYDLEDRESGDLREPDDLNLDERDFRTNRKGAGPISLTAKASGMSIFKGAGPRPFEARFPGRCSDCPRGIEVGQMIIKSSEGWCHAACSTE